jgi:Bifunctional PLP-dependent enzyme with beta-cystathionase and maltose regulon repressor activities
LMRWITGFPHDMDIRSIQNG